MQLMGKVALGAAVLGAVVSMTAPAYAATPKVKNPRHAKVIKRGVTKNGKFHFRTYNRKVYVHGKGWTRRVMWPRKLRVKARWQTRHSKCIRFNQRVRHGKGHGHRIICTPKISREQRLRMRLVEVAKSTLSSRTGFYRYSQGGYFSFDPTSYGRSDCSQWTASIYKRATGRFIGGNTWAQAAHGHRTRNPKPGDLMFSGSLGHVEMYVGNGRTIGHGSPPIDYASTSYWPGHFFVSYL